MLTFFQKINCLSVTVFKLFWYNNVKITALFEVKQVKTKLKKFKVSNSFSAALLQE